jgi:hypothetical protein
LELEIHVCQHCGRFDKVCDKDRGTIQNSRRNTEKQMGADIPLMEIDLQEQRVSLPDIQKPLFWSAGNIRTIRLKSQAGGLVDR